MQEYKGYIIYDDNTKVTTKENYNAYIMDAFKVWDFSSFEGDLNAIKTYLDKYFIRQ